MLYFQLLLEPLDQDPQLLGTVVLRFLPHLLALGQIQCQLVGIFIYSLDNLTLLILAGVLALGDSELGLTLECLDLLGKVLVFGLPRFRLPFQLRGEVIRFLLKELEGLL